MERIEEILEQVGTMAIAGHIRPDGDCIGSCMGLYNYIKENYPAITVHVYLEPPGPVFSYIPRMEEARAVCDPEARYDLLAVLDCSTQKRLGVVAECFAQAKKTVCIDHHVSNTRYADTCHVVDQASSASEVLYKMLDPEKVSVQTATCIYTGIIHDTGALQYQSTTPGLMRIVADLMEKGIDFSRIIDESFYQKTYIQNQVMGRVLAESIMLLDGACIVGVLKKKDLTFYGVEGKDLDGIVCQLRLTKGVEVAMFLYELESMEYKVSLRSNGRVDVNQVAAYFGGGGHVRAAGCEIKGTSHDVINNLTLHIEEQLQTGD
ncbi:MAG: bifunctional oligoribonuclease/PAP phosphatase NrnA [Lachnospiraceae bacterium]|jgi:phosphoesterase RecJ-like protein|nr:bifunctional oligoribonuclease/PAP phosphatase NrnA [Lachnospiraceae bacterium]MCI9388418.1 bifunctional oligoribonuclease/PAP phosphatase NrnA [Lachnospiraceae bacterium]MCI9469617.1 bifunctional oligoribonuclease/PAP phosphatase NrnA [Lachnospiraceae bacterium]